MTSVRNGCVTGCTNNVLCVGSGVERDHALLVKAVREVFNISMSSYLFLQRKNEVWGGEFTDVEENVDIVDKSVLAILSQVRA